MEDQKLTVPPIKLGSHRGPGVYPFNIVRSGFLEEY